MFKQLCLCLMFFRGFATASAFVENDLLTKVRLALNRVLDYVYDHRQVMNVDGLYGVVLAKAHLQSLKNCKSNQLKNLEKKTSNILNNVHFGGMKLNNNYKILAEYLMLNPEIWKKNITFARGKVTPMKSSYIPIDIITCNDFKNYLDNVEFEEEISDQCLVQLINSSISNSNECYVSNFCNKNFLFNDVYVVSFGILHKVLYFQVAEALKCNWNKRWIKKRIRKYCTNVLWEARKNAQCGFMSSLDDLFLEQIVLCGSEGYQEFLPSEWIKYVLGIQRKSGCFGVNEDYRDELKKRKRKREANELEFGCIDHTTGLGAAALSLFLRFFNRFEINC